MKTKAIAMLLCGIALAPGISSNSAKASEGTSLTESERALVTIAEANAQCLTETGKMTEKKAFDIADRFLESKNIDTEAIAEVKNEESFYDTKRQYIQGEGGCRALVNTLENPGSSNRTAKQSPGCPPGTSHYRTRGLFGLGARDIGCMTAYEAESLRRQNYQNFQNNLNQNRMRNCTTNFIGRTAYTNCY